MPSIPDFLTQIRQRQQRRLQTIDGSEPLPEHNPEMLYIGCIDARLDPIDDIGIPNGKALIYRNIGALVPPQGNGAPNPEAISVGATLEFFLREIPAKGKMKHIVISGHTHCGGVHYACAHDHAAHANDGFLSRYLGMLKDAIRSIFGQTAADAGNDAKMRQVEHESVRRSLENLMQYDVVKEALKSGKVQIHGWVINTANQHIEEMEKDKDGKFTGRFVDMSDNRQLGAAR